MWYVWWRVNIEGRTSAWHYPPKRYKTEKAARMAERDLNASSHYVGVVEHKALPEGVHPNSLGEDHGLERPKANS